MVKLVNFVLKVGLRMLFQFLKMCEVCVRRVVFLVVLQQCLVLLCKYVLLVVGDEDQFVNFLVVRVLLQQYLMQVFVVIQFLCGLVDLVMICFQKILVFLMFLERSLKKMFLFLVVRQFFRLQNELRLLFMLVGLLIQFVFSFEEFMWLISFFEVILVDFFWQNVWIGLVFVWLFVFQNILKLIFLCVLMVLVFVIRVVIKMMDLISIVS